MKKTFSLVAIGSLFAIGLMASTASAYTIGATITPLSSGDPYFGSSPTMHNGTIDTSVLAFGDYVGRNAGDPNAVSFGDSGASVGWDDTWVGGVGNANTNGDTLDGLWVQVYSDGGWWDLGAQYSEISVFTSQDHGPYIAEGIEYRVYGTNTLWDSTSLSAQASITDVYLDGWRTHNPAEDSNGNGWLSDDITGVFQLDGSYRYIKLVAWSSTGGYNEPEIDAVAGVVPEPSTMLLFGTGLASLAAVGRRRQK